MNSKTTLYYKERSNLKIKKEIAEIEVMGDIPFQFPNFKNVSFF